MRMLRHTEKDVVKKEIDMGGNANARVTWKPDKPVVGSTIGSIGW
ncbi:MAG: hypothetical protein ACFFA1_02310 [Promethearchaeota archaeon]